LFAVCAGGCVAAAEDWAREKLDEDDEDEED